MKCPHCGAEVAENVVICQSCGGRVLPDEEPHSPAVDSDPGAAEAEPAPAPAAGEAASGEAPPAEPEGPQEYPPPWRYSLKDMRMIWLNMLLFTLVMAGAAFGVMQVRPESWAWLTAPIVWGVMLCIPALCWIYQLCRAIYRTTIKYDLDESRLIHKEGIFVSKTDVIELIRIHDMGCTQSLLEKYLCGGIGQVRVDSEDPSNPQFVLRGLENHESVFRQIDQRRAEARRKKAFIQA